MDKNIQPIAYISNGYKEKFGIPRQSGLAESVESEIVFLKEYSDVNMFRGIEQYSHLWIIWGFSDNDGEWSATVRPPKLGGNERVGVFATRSPFRPNNLGLSCVKLKKAESNKGTFTLVVTGADLKDGTPVYDIKPYLPYVDSLPDAQGGFSEEHKEEFFEVVFECETNFSDKFINEISEILSLDPRPQYQADESRVYGMSYKNKEVKFICKDKKILVIDIREGEK